jgi:uncharacterized protein
MADLYERVKRFQQTNTSTKKPSPAPEKPDSVPKAVLQIPGVVRGSQLETLIEKRDASKTRFLASIGVEERENEFGKYGLREVKFTSRDLLYPAGDITGAELAAQTRDTIFCTLQARDFLYIDTETTGLAGGTGTLPFLIGVGFFSEDGYMIRQYLMRDYDEERAVLHEVEKDSARFPAVSSYNGKGFDIPLLVSRFLLNRMRNDLAERPHLDLLYSSRRLWKLRLPDCTLSTIEQAILGRSRSDDIPGEQIPYVYFDFLRGQRMARMRSVLHHNADDIFSLAMLSAKTCRIFREPYTECVHGSEFIGLARTAIAALDWPKAIAYFEHALEHPVLTDELRTLIQRHLSLLYKKEDNWGKAVAMWKQIAGKSEEIFPYIELAKFYEHRSKSLQEALAMTEQALEVLGIAESQWESRRVGRRDADALLHRRKRLKTKIGL